MRAMVRPRRTSMERTRGGAATVTEGWAMGAAGVSEVGVPKIGELVAGLAAVGMVIHDRSLRAGLGKFCRLRGCDGKADFSAALLTWRELFRSKMTFFWRRNRATTKTGKGTG